MDKKAFKSNTKRYPGILGFIILAVIFLAIVSFARGFQRELFFGVALGSIAFVGVLWVGAVMEGFKLLLNKQGRAVDAWLRILRWVDAFLGLIGICFCFYLALVLSIRDLGPITKGIIVVVLLFCSGMMYNVWLNWYEYSNAKRVAFVLPWVMVFCVIPIVAVFISAQRFGENPYRSPEDAIVNDLNNIAAHAYQYRIRPASMHGGAGSYVGYMIPSKMQSNANATYICKVTPNEISFLAVSADNSANTVKARIDSDGKFIKDSWIYTGDFE